MFYRCVSGDMLAFSNTRLVSHRFTIQMNLFLEISRLSELKFIFQLHGRTGYEDKEGNVRHLAGAYRELNLLLSHNVF